MKLWWVGRFLLTGDTTPRQSWPRLGIQGTMWIELLPQPLPHSKIPPTPLASDEKRLSTLRSETGEQPSSASLYSSSLDGNSGKRLTGYAVPHCPNLEVRARADGRGRATRVGWQWGK